MKKNYFLVITTLILSLIISCNNNEIDSTEIFNVKNLLKNEVNQQILPNVSAFVNAANSFNTTIENYTEQTTESNLITAREKWKTIALAYESIYAFNIGEVRDQFLHLAIYNWPATESAIENNITNSNIDEAFMETLSPIAKSISAIEYLLFNSSITNVNSEFINSENRRDYLKLSAQFINNQSQRLNNIWLPTGNDYANTFINSNETGINSSFNLFFNGLHNLIDTGKVTKIGKPAGLENSTVINPELTQAFYSNESLQIIKANMESISNAYFNDNGTLGIDDYVFHITKNNELNDLVATKINAVISAVNTISSPLDEAITTEHELVEDLHTKLEELRIIFAVDLRSTLSLIITTTDNDGD